MRALVGVFFVLVSELIAAGQAKNPSIVSQSSQRQTQHEITELKEQLRQLQDKLGALGLKLSLLEDKLSLDEHMINQKEFKRTTVELSEGGYRKLDTDDGTFLVGIDQVTSYLNGYKLTLLIGNPSSAMYRGFKVKIRWGTVYSGAFGDKKAFDEWEKSIQEKEQDFADVLEPGSWNKAAFVVIPAAAPQLGMMSISMTTGRVVLRQNNH